MDLVKSKHPVLYKIFNERKSLRFKNAKWVEKQNQKKQNSKVQNFKNLKKILTHFDYVNENIAGNIQDDGP